MATKIVLVVVVAAALIGVVWLVGKARAHPSVTVTLRFTVSPKDQSGFVAAEANSAKFKYLMGKQSGVKPVLAQKLAVKPVPNSPEIEAQLEVMTREEGARYAAAFVETLQFLCGTQAQVVAASQGIR